MTRLATALVLALSISSRADEPRRDRFGDPLPVGAVARLGTANAHPSASCITYSADGKTIITTSGDVARHWDAESGRVRRVIAHPKQFEDVLRALSTDGRIAAIVFEDGVEVHELATGKVLHRVGIPRLKEIAKNHFGPPPLAAFAISPSGDLVVLRIEKGLETLVIRNGRLEVWPGFDDESESPAFSHDGKWLAMRLPGEPNQIGFRSTADAAPVFKFAHDGPAHAIAPDGSLVAVSNRDSGASKFRLLDPKTGRPVVGNEFTVWGEPQTASFSADGRLLAVATHKEIALWDTAAKRLVWKTPGRARALAFSPDARRLAGIHDLLHVWDAATGKPTTPDFGPLPERLMGYTTHKSRVVLLNDHQLQVWDWTSGRPSFVTEFDGDYSRTNTWLSADGARAYAFDGTAARAWDVASGKLLLEFNPSPKGLVGGWRISGPPCPSSDGSTFGILFLEGPEDVLKTSCLVERWDANTGKLLSRREVKLPPFHSAGVMREPDEIWAEVNGNHPTQIYDTRTGQAIPQPKFTLEGMEVNGPHCSTPGKRLQAYQLTRVGNDTVVHDIAIVDGVSGQLLSRIPAGFRQRGGSVMFEGTTKALSPDGRWLAIGKRDGIELWDLIEQQRVPFHAPHATPPSFFFEHRYSELVFMTNDRLLEVCSDSCALVWELPAAARMRPKLPITAATWDDLGSDDPKTALRAVWALKGDPTAGVTMLRRIPRVVPADEKRLAELFADLGSRSHATREAATKRLRDLGRTVVPFLASAIAKSTDAEQAGRAQQLLDRFQASGPASGEERRAARAVYAAELIGSDAGRSLLADWAKGADGAILTREAKAALARLEGK